MTKKKPVRKPVSKSRVKAPLKPEEELAARCAALQSQVMRAGRPLHDHAGPLLSAAGIHLQLLKMDMPEVAVRIHEVTSILEQALANVREVSQDLAPSPVFRGGLERALMRLAEDVAETAPVDIVIDCESPISANRESQVAIYDLVSSAVKSAVRASAGEVEVRVRHNGKFSARVEDNGKSAGRAKALAVASLLARRSGLQLDIATGKSTIVSIRTYALRRTVG